MYSPSYLIVAVFILGMTVIGHIVWAMNRRLERDDSADWQEYSDRVKKTLDSANKDIIVCWKCGQSFLRVEEDKRCPSCRVLYDSIERDW